MYLILSLNVQVKALGHEDEILTTEKSIGIVI